MSLRLLVRAPTGYAFRHALLRDAVLDRLRPSEFRALHRRAAVALESLGQVAGQDRVPPGPGGRPGRCRAVDAAGSETSAALGAYREAMSTLEQVRAQAVGVDLARLLSLRAELLMPAPTRARSTHIGRLWHWPRSGRPLSTADRVGQGRTFAGDLDTAAIALDGLVTDGSPEDTELLLARGPGVLPRRSRGGRQRRLEARRR